MFETRLSTATVVLSVLTLGSGCRTLDESIEPIKANYALSPATGGKLFRLDSACRAGQDPGESSFLILDQGEEALRWRLALVDSAERSVDVLSFLWQPDASGWLLFRHVYLAAERGVRVRILLDDILLAEQDHFLAALNDHPNIEVRAFNPWSQREFGHNLEFITQLDELNHRMHDKILVADNLAAVSGGRNIGDEYFGLYPVFNFHDFDLLGVGPIVRSLSETFDYYWNCDPVVSAAALWKGASVKELPELVVEGRQVVENSPRLERFPRKPQDWTERLTDVPSKMASGRARVVYDRVKGVTPSRETARNVLDLLASAEKEVLILNAYLIPGDVFLKTLKDATSRGVRVRIMTNSLGSTNHAAVNSVYKKTRKPLLEAGAELYELQPDPAIRDVTDTPPVSGEFVGLHAKVLVADRRHLFIGSYNLDPRSLNINTEMGIIVDSPELGRQLAELLDRDMSPDNAWRVHLDDDGKLVCESTDGILDEQPAQDFWQRFSDGFYGILPIHNQM